MYSPLTTRGGLARVRSEEVVVGRGLVVGVVDGAGDPEGEEEEPIDEAVEAVAPLRRKVHGGCIALRTGGVKWGGAAALRLGITVAAPG